MWFGELPQHLLHQLREQARVLVADAQGFVRHVLPASGKIERRDWLQKREYLPLFDLFKVDSNEALLLTGCEDADRACLQLCQEHGARRVLLTHATGIVFYDATVCPAMQHSATFGAYRMEGRTGRGDTVTAAFLAAGWRPGVDAQKVKVMLDWAAAVATRKMQYAGPLRLHDGQLMAKL